MSSAFFSFFYILLQGAKCFFLFLYREEKVWGMPCLSIMVERCISACCIGDVSKTDGIINVVKYRQIPVHHTIPFAKHMIGNGFIF